MADSCFAAVPPPGWCGQSDQLNASDQNEQSDCVQPADSMEGGSQGQDSSATTTEGQPKKRDRWSKAPEAEASDSSKAEGDGKKKSRWGSKQEPAPPNLALVPYGSPIPTNSGLALVPFGTSAATAFAQSAHVNPVNPEQLKIQLRIAEIQNLYSRPSLEDYIPREYWDPDKKTWEMRTDGRSPSPEPQYDRMGRRTNTRDLRMRMRLQRERQSLLEKLCQLNPGLGPAFSFPKEKKQIKLYVPQKEYPNYPFIGLILGPRGNTQKKLERETGAKIIIRGRGSVKDGKKAKFDNDPSADEELHVHITADTDESLEAARKIITELLTPKDDDTNDWKRTQLRELALINGTLRDDQDYFKEEMRQLARQQEGIVGVGSGATADAPWRLDIEQQHDQMERDWQRTQGGGGEGPKPPPFNPLNSGPPRPYDPPGFRPNFPPGGPGGPGGHGGPGGPPMGRPPMGGPPPPHMGGPPNMGHPPHMGGPPPHMGGPPPHMHGPPPHMAGPPPPHYFPPPPRPAPPPPAAQQMDKEFTEFMNELNGKKDSSAPPADKAPASAPPAASSQAGGPPPSQGGILGTPHGSGGPPPPGPHGPPPHGFGYGGPPPYGGPVGYGPGPGGPPGGYGPGPGGPGPYGGPPGGGPGYGPPGGPPPPWGGPPGGPPGGWGGPPPPGFHGPPFGQGPPPHGGYGPPPHHGGGYNSGPPPASGGGRGGGGRGGPSYNSVPPPSQSAGKGPTGSGGGSGSGEGGGDSVGGLGYPSHPPPTSSHSGSGGGQTSHEQGQQAPPWGPPPPTGGGGSWGPPGGGYQGYSGGGGYR